MTISSGSLSVIASPCLSRSMRLSSSSVLLGGAAKYADSSHWLTFDWCRGVLMTVLICCNASCSKRASSSRIYCSCISCSVFRRLDGIGFRAVSSTRLNRLLGCESVSVVESDSKVLSSEILECLLSRPYKIKYTMVIIYDCFTFFVPYSNPQSMSDDC